MRCWSTVPMVCCNVERSFLSLVILFLSFQAMLNDRSHRLMRCWTTVPMVWCNVERSYFLFVILFLSFDAMLNNRPHRLMRCWTTVPMVWCNVERPFFVIWYCSYGLMQCWTTVLVVCHIVPIVWSNVERSFSLSNAMLNDCSYGLILCWTTVLVVCHVVPIVWCNYKCFQKKHWHTGYIITIDPPLCVVSTCTKPKSCKVVPKKTDIIFLQRAGCYATIFVDDGQLPGRLEFWFGFWGGRPDWWDEILLICGNKTLTVSIQVVFFRLFSSIAALAHVCTCGLCKPNLLST